MGRVLDGIAAQVQSQKSGTALKSCQRNNMDATPGPVNLQTPKSQNHKDGEAARKAAEATPPNRAAGAILWGHLLPLLPVLKLLTIPPTANPTKEASRESKEAMWPRRVLSKDQTRMPPMFSVPWPKLSRKAEAVTRTRKREKREKPEQREKQRIRKLQGLGFWARVRPRAIAREETARKGWGYMFSINMSVYMCACLYENPALRKPTGYSSSRNLTIPLFVNRLRV